MSDFSNTIHTYFVCIVFFYVSYLVLWTFFAGARTHFSGAFAVLRARVISLRAIFLFYGRFRRFTGARDLFG